MRSVGSQGKRVKCAQFRASRLRCYVTAAGHGRMQRIAESGYGPAGRLIIARAICAARLSPQSCSKYTSTGYSRRTRAMRLGRTPRADDCVFLFRRMFAGYILPKYTSTEYSHPCSRGAAWGRPARADDCASFRRMFAGYILPKYTSTEYSHPCSRGAACGRPARADDCAPFLAARSRLYPAEVYFSWISSPARAMRLGRTPRADDCAPLSRPVRRLYSAEVYFHRI